MKKKRLLIGTIILFIIMIFILYFINILLLPKSNIVKDSNLNYDYNYCMWKEFYKYKDNELEIVNLGSSHSNCAVIPSVLDKKLKIDSYNLSTMGVNIEAIYY